LHFAFLLSRSDRCARTNFRASAAAFRPVLYLNYAENVRLRLKAGILRSSTEPEGPHDTTESIKRIPTITQLRERWCLKIDSRQQPVPDCQDLPGEPHHLNLGGLAPRNGGPDVSNDRTSAQVHDLTNLTATFAGQGRPETL
jgi:hypothetical protein